jgi:hypothetical protein
MYRLMVWAASACHRSILLHFGAASAVLCPAQHTVSSYFCMALLASIAVQH